MHAIDFARFVHITEPLYDEDVDSAAAVLCAKRVAVRSRVYVGIRCRECMLCSEVEAHVDVSKQAVGVVEL